MKTLNISLAITFALMMTLFGNHSVYAEPSGKQEARERCNDPKRDPRKYPNVPNVENGATFYSCVDSALGGYDPVLMDCAENYLVFVYEKQWCVPAE